MGNENWESGTGKLKLRFRDRVDAGQQLATALAEFADRADVVVLALPRGGVPVAWEVARALSLPMDVFLVRKLGVPGHPELAMGAIAAGDIQVLSDDLIQELRIPPALVQQTIARERVELERRERLFRESRPLPDILNRTVLLVDDGLATGSTMAAAIAALRQQKPDCIVVAAPVGASGTCERLSHLADKVVCLLTPYPFDAVGQWYERFDQTSDDEVRRLLASCSSPDHAGRSARHS